jgi:hypothetical protein
VLVAEPEALQHDVLESCLYILRGRLRGTPTITRERAHAAAPPLSREPLRGPSWRYGPPRATQGAEPALAGNEDLRRHGAVLRRPQLAASVLNANRYVYRGAGLKVRSCGTLGSRIR